MDYLLHPLGRKFTSLDFIFENIHLQWLDLVHTTCGNSQGIQKFVSMTLSEGKCCQCIYFVLSMAGDDLSDHYMSHRLNHWVPMLNILRYRNFVDMLRTSVNMSHNLTLRLIAYLYHHYYQICTFQNFPHLSQNA